MPRRFQYEETFYGSKAARTITPIFGSFDQATRLIKNLVQPPPDTPEEERQRWRQEFFFMLSRDDLESAKHLITVDDQQQSEIVQQ
ncbi:MAG: hypothetical protein U5O39_03390 [Gammaproteobacteria bacterium]|nr:hypothetical protein [Gammaproteobacteria bacterium]